MVNFQITQGTGTIIATDVGGGGENYQKLKLIDATTGATQATGVAANPLQVSLAFTGINTVPLLIDGSGVTQPISGTISAIQSGVWNLVNISGTISLPTGAATEVTLTDIKSDLDQLTFVASRLLIDGSGVTQPISAITLPLPTGAATESTLTNIKDDVDNLDVALSTRASEATLANVKTDLDKFTFISSALLVDGSGVLQPVAISQVGTDNNVQITNFPSSQTINGTVAATQSGTWTVALSSGAIEIGTVDQGIPAVLANAWPILPTDGTNSQVFTATGEGKVAVTQPLPAGTNVIGSVTQSGTWNLVNISGTVSLPTGASTEATLSNLNSKVTVVDTDSVTISAALPPGTNVIGHVVSDSGSTTAITGNVSVVQSTAANLNATITGTVVATQSTGTNLHTVVDSGSITVANATIAVIQSGTWNLNNISGTISLPTGASTAAKQPALGTSGTASSDVITVQGIVGMTAIKVDGSAVTQPISGSVSVSNFPATQPVSGTVSVSNFPATQAVTQSGTWTVGLTTESIEIGKVDQGTANTLANAWPVELTDGTNILGVSAHPVRTDPTGTTIQPVSGTITANAGTGTFAISAASLPLPTGAATSAKQPALGTAGTASSDIITVQGIASMTALKVDGSAVTQPISGTVSATQGTSPWVVSVASTTITGTVAVTQSTSPWVVSGTVTANAGSGSFTVAQATGTNLHTVVDSGTITIGNASLPVTQSGTWNITNVSGTVSLPTGASTAAKQPAIGTAGTASADVITVQGVASMTALKVDGSAVTQPVSGSVSVSNFPATQPVSGTITANIGTTNGLALDATLTGGTQKTKLVDSAGTNVATISAAGALKVDGSAVTQPVSGTITANQGTSPWVVSVASTTITGTVAVTQSTSPWVVSGTVTSNIGTTNGLALDATVAALEVAQASTTSGQKGILQLGAVTTGSPTYTTAQTSALSLTTAGALRVDASATTQPISGSITVANATIAVTQSGTWNINNISGTISLPTGASTETTLASLNGKVTTVNTGAVTISTALPAGTNVIGHIIADSGSTTAVTGNVSVVQTTAANLNATVVGTVTANQGTANATPWNENISQIGGNAVATAATGIIKVGVTDSSGNSLTSTVDGSQRGLDSNIVNIQDNMGTGTIVALNGSVSAITNGSSVVNFQVTGTWSATLTIQGSVDGITWNTIVGDVDITDTITSIITANTFVSVGCGGFQQVRLTATAFTSGTVNIAWEASIGSSLSEVYNTNPASLQTTTTPITIAKGTQGTTGFTTQDLKDAGRQYVTFTADAVAGVTSEALLSVTQNKQGVTTAAVTSYTVTNGKTLRIQSITVGIENGVAAAEWVRVKIRHNTAGATTTTSALVYTVACGISTTSASTSGQISVPIPDGLEIFGNGTQTIGISHISSATTNIESITVCGYEY